MLCFYNPKIICSMEIFVWLLLNIKKYKKKYLNSILINFFMAWVRTGWSRRKRKYNKECLQHTLFEICYIYLARKKPGVVTCCDLYIVIFTVFMLCERVYVRGKEGPCGLVKVTCCTGVIVYYILLFVFIYKHNSRCTFDQTSVLRGST